MAQMLGALEDSLKNLSVEERLGIMLEKKWLAKKNSRIKRLLNNVTHVIAYSDNDCNFLFFDNYYKQQN